MRVEDLFGQTEEPLFLGSACIFGLLVHKDHLDAALEFFQALAHDLVKGLLEQVEPIDLNNTPMPRTMKFRIFLEYESLRVKIEQMWEFEN